MASSDHHAYGNAHGAYRPHQSQYDGPTTTQPPPPHNAVYDPTTYHNRSPQKQQPMDAAYRSYAPDEQRYRASSIRDAEKKAEQHAAYLQQLEQTKRQQQQLEQQRERQVRDEADVFGPSHGHARPRGRGAYTTANVVAIVPEANPKPSIATLADASPSPAQKRAQQAAYAKSIADAAASDGPHAARHLVHRPRMPANETFMHENNLFSALSQEEAEDSAKGRKRAQQAEYARMLQAQQRAKEHEPPDRGLDAHVRAPVSGKARPGANDDDDAYYDLGGAGTGMIANIGAASGGTSPSRHTQPPVVSHQPHQQPAAPSSSSSKQPWQAHGGNAPPYQQRPSGPGHPHEYGDPGPGGDDEYYPQYHSGQRGPHDDNRGPPQQPQQPRQPGGAPRGGREQEAAAAAEQKREQQRRYYEEIAHAAAAPPIRRERAPLHRAKTPHGRADVESWEGTGTGFQVGEPVRYPGGGVPARTPAEVEQAESRARKQALQRTYAKQLAADAIAPVLPADRVYTGRSRAAAGEEDVDTNPYSGYDPWRSARHGSDDPNDASSSIGRATGIFEPMTAQEIAERAAAKKKASQAEYYQQLQEFEEQKARTAAAVARTPRTSLYRLQQQQKDAEVQNLTAATRYKGESPLTRRAQRGGHESDGGGGGGGGYVYGDGDGDMDGVGGYPLPYDDRGSSGRSRSRRAPDPVDAQAAAWRRQQQRQYHEALEADARAAPTPATYTPQRKPWHERAARDGDDEAEQNAYSPHLHPSYHSNSKRPGPGTPYNKRRTDRDGDGDGDAGGRRDGYDGEVRRDGHGHGHGQQPQYQPQYQPPQQPQPQQQPHRLDMAVPGNYGYGQGNGYIHGQNQSQSQSQSHTYGYGNAAAGGDGALPSYRSGAATPRAQGYPGGGGTGTGTTTPGTGSATGTTTPSAAYGRTQLFNAAGGPSVGAPSRGVTDAPGPSTVAAVYPSASSYTYGARGPSYQPYAATPAGHPTPSRGLMGAALPASRGRSSGGGKSSISF